MGSARPPEMVDVPCVYHQPVPGFITLAGMGLQIPSGALKVSLGEDDEPAVEVECIRLRMDLWPTWLEIGCTHTEEARRLARQLDRSEPNEQTDLLSGELRAGLVAITAFAFSLDGFYDTVRNELGPHPDHATWRAKKKSRAAQVCETMRYHLKLEQKASVQLRLAVDELFEFRDRAVHPNGEWVAPNYRPSLDSGVHPHLLTFSGPHAVQVRAVVLGLLDALVRQAQQLARPGSDSGWLQRGRDEVDRLVAAYRVDGDDQVAFPSGEYPEPNHPESQ